MTIENTARPLAGRVALVTGTAQGIGQAIAVRLGEAGATVLGVDLAPQHETAELVAATGVVWEAHSGDVSDADSVETIAAAAHKHDRLDILVNNAAIDDALGFDELTMERWDRIMKVNLEGPFRLIKALVPLMRDHGFGRIINLASGSVVNPMTGFIAYRASKMGVIGMTRALATELGRDGITVNVVSPGVTMTAMALTGLSEEFRAMTIGKQGVKRAGLPADIAEAVAFLASAEAGFITGQTLMVNGGAAFT